MDEKKTCSKCKRSLARDCFHKNRSKLDGLMYSCKDCRNDAFRKERARNPEIFRERSRQHHAKNADDLNEKKRAYHKRNAEAIGQRYRRSYDPIKNSAQGRVRYAVETGELVRPIRCSKCNEECKAQAHHPDYSKPLDVIWLCQRCHQRLHSRERGAAAGAEPTIKTRGAVNEATN